ncbi:K(+)/H(+) antiporter 1 [Nocardia gamkensis]|nr:K(+)/H(+) antiporter 1 [Nocardia gamkensis]
MAATSGRIGGALLVVLLVAALGRPVARWLRQPSVLAEIAIGIGMVPAATAVAGTHAVQILMPSELVVSMRVVGHVGLVLFLVGIAHHLRTATLAAPGRAVVFTTLGALLLPLAAGSVLGGVLLACGSPTVRGNAPAPAVVLLIAVSLSVTAVPVLARILAEKGLIGTAVGGLAMSSAIAIDIVAWLLVALAVGLSGHSMGGAPALRAIVGLSVITVALVVGRILRTETSEMLCRRFPRYIAVAIACAALAASSVLQQYGFTEISGELLVGFMIPSGAHSMPWHLPVGMITCLGRHLVPVFFVATGTSIFTSGTYFPWMPAALATLLSTVGKLGGSYLGARIGGQRPSAALRLGILLNTRGLTELVVVQVGYNAGILTPTVLLALIAMALVTTAMTGPVYALIEVLDTEENSGQVSRRRRRRHSSIRGEEFCPPNRLETQLSRD